MSKKYLLLILPAVILPLIFAGLKYSSAQISEPQLFLNWQAGTFVPPEFSGKVMPGSGSRLIVGMDLFDQGRPVNLSSFDIQWYINDDFYQNSVGLTRIILTAPNFIGSTSIRVRGYVPDYAGGVGKTIVIPVVPPELAIRSSSPSLAASETPFTLTADPYFFNIQDANTLQVEWFLNGTSVGSGRQLSVTPEFVKSGLKNLEVRGSNPNKKTERASRNLTLFP